MVGGPATGKTTIGRRLADYYKLTYMSKDGVKEPIFDNVGCPTSIENDSPLSGINERLSRTPRIVTHRNGNMTVNLPGSVTQATTTEDIINESFNSHTPISIRPSVYQIRRATRVLEFRDISNSSQHICPIDREILNPSDSVMQVLHCNHVFT